MMRSSIWVKLSAAAALLIGIFAVNAYRSRPALNPQLVGTWKGNLYTKNIYKFRNDGTYESTSFDANIRGYKDIELRSSGTWLYRPNEIIFNREKHQAFQNGKPFPKILEIINDVEKRSGGIPIKWLDEKRWMPTQVGIGHFYKTGT